MSIGNARKCGKICGKCGEFSSYEYTKFLLKVAETIVKLRNVAPRDIAEEAL